MHLHCDTSSGFSARNTPTVTVGTPLSNTGAGVRQAVESVKNRLPVHCRYQRPRAAGRCVTKQAGPHHLYSLKPEGGGLTGLQRGWAARLVFAMNKKNGREMKKKGEKGIQSWIQILK